VPVILGTLTSNLKDQRPFISIKENGRPGAKELYDKAKEELRNGNSNLAAELFRKAKDLDCLRFRASEDVNKIIRQLGKQFINPVVDIDSVFNASSPDGIVGDNLMVDHLHPTLSGYKLISSLYYNQMKKSHLLPKSSPLEIKEMQLDSLVNISYKTTRLDSIIAINRIKVLKNDWPYIDKKDKKPLEQIIERKDYIDSLALDVIYNDVTWEKAHRLAAQWYLKKNNIPEFQNYMDVLIEQYPIIVEYYDFIANKFIEMKMYDIAYNYLLKGFEIKRNAYFAKWLGIIDLSKMKTDRAINYLNLSLKYDARDPQVLYNLAGAYVYKNDYNKALDIINRCLEFNPNFPDAGSLKNQLVKALSK
jgi:tetratricopeptide (TPR) repeat protein